MEQMGLKQYTVGGVLPVLMGFELTLVFSQAVKIGERRLEVTERWIRAVEDMRQSHSTAGCRDGMELIQKKGVLSCPVGK